MNKLKLFMLPLALPLLMNCGGGEGENSRADAADSFPLIVEFYWGVSQPLTNYFRPNKATFFGNSIISL